MSNPTEIKNGSDLDYKSKINMIRNPETNRMSRTRTRTPYRSPGKSPSGKRKKKGYAGAYVAEVRRQIASGFKVAGTVLKHLHALVIDMDLTSLYPSIMLLLNLCPKSFVAKLIFSDEIIIPMYDYIKFLDKEEEAEYKCNANDFAMECLIGKHYWALMEVFCNMPETGEILNYIASHPEKFRKVS